MKVNGQLDAGPVFETTSLKGTQMIRFINLLPPPPPYFLPEDESRTHCRNVVQGGSNMTGTNCDLFTHNQSRSYLNHLVILIF
jgi:hypothetical protein